MELLDLARGFGLGESLGKVGDRGRIILFEGVDYTSRSVIFETMRVL